MTYTKENVSNIFSNNGVIELNDSQKQVIADEWNAYANKSGERKLAEIKKVRLQKLEETDYMANSDYTMPSYIKTWRQSLRDIPANNDSSKYDDLLKRDDNGNLTHTIWTQPTE